MKYEAHIVGYKGDLGQVPKPFFLNPIDVASQGFTGIATFESDDLDEVYHAWETGCAWAAEQLRTQPTFGCHVKLEENRDRKRYADAGLKEPAPVVENERRYAQSAQVSAWDVHMDGRFHPALLARLEQAGFIRLDYLDGRGRPATTMTLHFLRSVSCREEYARIIGLIDAVGGFEGTLYWEDPLAFTVFGDTLSRPIIIG